MPLIESFSGIRGIWNHGLDIDVCIGYAYLFRKFLENKNAHSIQKVVIARDTRHSSNEISDAITQVFDEVIDIGIATTPMAEHAVRAFKASGGIMITASHNEPEWNGLKFLDDDGAVLRINDIHGIIAEYQKIKNKDIRMPKRKAKSTNIFNYNKEIISEYADFVRSTIGKDTIKSIIGTDAKFLLDANGGAGIKNLEVLKQLGIRHDAINTKESVFPRRIEPNENSLAYLKEIIREKNLALAFGFDCDADRAEVVFSDGVINGHYLLALAVDFVLSKSKNPSKETIVINDATSGIVSYAAKKFNAKLIETDVGEINVVEEMLRQKSIIGGEGSSSGVILRPSRCRDGLLTSLIILGILAEKGKPIRNIIAEYPQYTTLRNDLKIEINNIDKFKERIAGYYKKKKLNVKKSEAIKVFLDDNSFVWFRMSKTENNLLRIIADSHERKKAESAMAEAISLVNG